MAEDMMGALGGALPGGMPGAVPPTGGLPMGNEPTPLVGDIPLDEDIMAVESSMERDAETVMEEKKAFEDKVQYDITDEEKASIVKRIVQIIDDCEKERAEWKSIRKECMDILNGVRPPKNDPWPNCSNITTMAAATHCKLMHAKLFPAIWNENLVYWKPVEKNDVANVEHVQKFMQWVVQQELKLQDVIDDAVWDLIVNGTVALKTRWDTEYRMISEIDDEGNIEYKKIAHEKCTVDNVPIDEVYLPTLWEGVNKSEFIAQDIYIRYPEIEELVDRGIYRGDDILTKLLPKLDEAVPDSLRKQKQDIEGTYTYDYDAHKNSIPIRLIECYMKWPVPDPITGKREMVDSVFTIAYESEAYLSGKPLTAVSPIGKRPWVIGQFMRRTGRPYGISLLELIRGLAKELDAIHNQRIDAGTIAIAPFGFYRAASSFRPENIMIGPGVMIPVDDTGDVNVIQLQHNPVASFQEERVIIEYIEKLTSTSAYQMGRESDIVKSRATASATIAIIGQGEQAFSLLGIRTQAIVANLMTQILQQYQMNMPEGYADSILGEAPGDLLFPDGANRAMIAGQFDAYMTLDMTVGNKAMERQANLAMVQMGANLMAMAQDPRGYEMARDFLKSIGKVDVERYLGPKPQGKSQGMPPVGPGMEDVMGGMGGGNEAGQPV